MVAAAVELGPVMSLPQVAAALDEVPTCCSRREKYLRLALGEAAAGPEVTYRMEVSISSPRTVLTLGSHGETETRTPTLLVRIV
jgi:hypothetical protein